MKLSPLGGFLSLPPSALRLPTSPGRQTLNFFVFPFLGTRCRMSCRDLFSLSRLFRSWWGFRQHSHHNFHPTLIESTPPWPSPSSEPAFPLSYKSILSWSPAKCNLFLLLKVFCGARLFQAQGITWHPPALRPKRTPIFVHSDQFWRRRKALSLLSGWGTPPLPHATDIS